MEELPGSFAVAAWNEKEQLPYLFFFLNFYTLRKRGKEMCLLLNRPRVCSLSATAFTFAWFSSGDGSRPCIPGEYGIQPQPMQFCECLIPGKKKKKSNNGIKWHISCDEAICSISTFLMCLEDSGTVKFKHGLEEFCFLTQECATSKKGTADIYSGVDCKR